MLPLLLNRLESPEVVVYTRTLQERSIACCLCVLEVRSRLCAPCPISPIASLSSVIIKFCRFSSTDVQPFAPQLLNVILAMIGVQNSSERTAEKDFLMRCACALGVLHVVSDQWPSHWQVLRKLSSRRNKRSSESTSPCFRGSSISSARWPRTQVTRTLNQYISKTISSLIRFIGAIVPDSIAVFESYSLRSQKSCTRK